MNSSATPDGPPQPLNGNLPDAAPRNWLDAFAPDWLKPYGRLARWDRPIGWWLLLWPCWWALALATDFADLTLPSPFYLALFMIGAIAMRGAGCTYNDLVDRDLDLKVARTAERPIASGRVSVAMAIVFLVLQSLVGLLVLLQFNFYTIVLGLCSLLVVAIYPFMKRVTDWPQLVLGLAFSWGALVGWTAVVGELHPAAIALYVGSILWTMAYDTIYALQDKEDDALVGIRSTARLFGDRAKPAIAILFSLAILAMGLAIGLSGAGFLAYVGLIAFAGHLGWQTVSLDIHDPDNCLRRFRGNGWAGWLLFAGLVLAGLI